MNRKKLFTYAFISRFFFGHHISRLWRQKARQDKELGKFLENYRADRILPLTPEERAILPTFQACVSCGLCTNECILAAAPGDLLAGSRIEPRNIAVSYVRSIPDYWSIRDILAGCEECNLCEEICPTDAPLKRMVRFIEERAREEAPA